MAHSKELKDEVVRLYRTGLSASEIARRLALDPAFRASLSRNAVIGIVHRWLAKTGEARNVRAVPEAPKAKAPRKPAPPPRLTTPTPAPSAPVPKLAIGELPPVEAANGAHPDLVALKRRQCKWPVGEAAGMGQLFCGARVGADGEDGRPQPYCTVHARKAYQPRDAASKRSGQDLARALRRYI